jgi:3-oxoacyl-[acyl-carrier-protein] synthase-1
MSTRGYVHALYGGQHGTALALACPTAVTPIGFSSYETWANRRAELTGYGESPFRMSDGERATMAFVPTLAPTSYGLARMLVLLERVLSPLYERVRAGLPQLGRDARIGVGIALSERFAERRHESGHEHGHALSKRFFAERRALESFVLERARDHSLEVVLSVSASGHASTGEVLAWGARALSQNEMDVLIVAGVDTYYDPDVMQALMLERRVFCTDSIDAIIPGEAAAALLLGRPRTLRGLGASTLLGLEGVAVGHEPACMGRRSPCAGTGLTRTLLPLVDRLRAEGRSLDWILGDVTNEDYRAHEFQLTYPRIVRDVLKREIPVEFLPMSMGDLGAATLTVALSIVAEAMRRGDPQAETCLLHASSVGEARAGVLASRLEGG